MRIIKENQMLHTVYRLEAEEPDQVLGEAVVSEHQNEIRLHGIFVRPEHRGKGYATSLMQQILSLGNEKTITLCTGLGNIGFFKRFGFQVTQLEEALVSMEKKP